MKEKPLTNSRQFDKIKTVISKTSKIAVTGKGGAGKSTISASLSIFLSKKGKDVWLIDCDPDANLATILGYPYPDKLQPIVELKEIIQERTLTKNSGSVPFFKMNPDVSDIPEKFSVEHNGVHLMLMGKMKPAKGGCFCPENAFVKSLISHLLLKENEVVIMDMEAGIEHLSRGTASAVDVMLIITEPSFSSIETTKRILTLAKQLNIKKVLLIANKIHNDRDRDFITNKFSENIVLFIPYNTELEKNRGVIDSDNKILDKEMEKIISYLEENK
ncbi:MAG: carbon monoxide dehydrogenase [Elusimicrobia bacterium CG06_land_8_20_14_3_00_38_11]|nr:MAG: carbon monoxide dehydrogenase [Elusimicrobia bacterium CG06_land_8_20_14_3_00_38_11]